MPAVSPSVAAAARALYTTLQSYCKPGQLGPGQVATTAEITQLASTIESCMGDSGLTLDALTAVQQLALASPINSERLASHCLPSILKCMDAHRDNAVVQQRACFSLATLASRAALPRPHDALISTLKHVMASTQTKCDYGSAYYYAHEVLRRIGAA